MNFKHPNGGLQTVTWSDHYPGCSKCREVDLDKPATFVNACGFPCSALLGEEMKKRAAPIAAKKAAEIKAWATEAGFKTDPGVSKEKLRQITRYVGER